MHVQFQCQRFIQKKKRKTNAQKSIRKINFRFRMQSIHHMYGENDYGWACAWKYMRLNLKWIKWKYDEPCFDKLIDVYIYILYQSSSLAFYFHFFFLSVAFCRFSQSIPTHAFSILLSSSNLLIEWNECNQIHFFFIIVVQTTLHFTVCRQI